MSGLCQSVSQLALAEVGTAEHDALVEHLDSCERCQRQLDTQVADEGVTEMLEHIRSVGTSTQAIDTDNALTADRARGGDWPALAVPSHPELLGRVGRYDVERVVGHGGMGVVYKAFDTELHRVVAVKSLASHLAANAAARRRFAREAQAAAAVLHPNVIPIYNVEAEGDSPYLVMQYVAGESLQARVERIGPLPVADALRITKQISEGLAAAHAQGLVHRDVKPANILLEDQTDRVVISDFGLARTSDDASLTQTGIVAGTPHYMSPEQATGAEVSSQSDLFALGSVLYFMLTGRLPFRAESAMGVLHCICTKKHRPVSQVNADVPRELSRLVDRLLAKKPSKRPHSATQVADQVEDILSRLQSGGLRLVSHVGQPETVLAAIVLVGFFAASAWWMNRWWGPQQESQATPRQAKSTSGDQAIHRRAPNAARIGTSVGIADSLEHLRADFEVRREVDDGLQSLRRQLNEWTVPPPWPDTDARGTWSDDWQQVTALIDNLETGMQQYERLEKRSLLNEGTKK